VDYYVSVNYNYKKGIDTPVWQWLAFFPGGNSNPGTSNIYDGKRYIYWLVQTGTTATSASTTLLYRYDTWDNGWQYLANTTSGNQGMDLEYDSVRNVIIITHGVSLTSWQVFNLNTTAITIANVSCAPWALTTMTPVLPAAPLIGASITLPSSDVVPAVIDTGTANATGNTTTVVTATTDTGTFGLGMVGLQLRVTSGAQNGQKRTISAVSAPNTLTVAPALPGALGSGDTFTIEQVEDVLTAATTTVLTDSTASWTVNQYANMDVIITSGAQNGQRRRIASNTATALTLAGATTGNARTGALPGAPEATATFKIVPSDDFLYYQPGNNTTTLYRIDLAQTTGAAWSAALAAAPAGISGGGNTFYPAAYAPYNIVALRGNASKDFYLYNIGLNTWTTMTTFAGSETFTTGSSSAMVTGKRKLLIQKEGFNRILALDLLTGIVEPAGTMPYSVPASYDGKRMRVVTTPDGAQFLYIMRAGGPEFFRVALEWL
jgi:N-acetylneuraminic acid mutarotase